MRYRDPDERSVPQHGSVFCACCERGVEFRALELASIQIGVSDFFSTT